MHSFSCLEMFLRMKKERFHRGKVIAVESHGRRSPTVGKVSLIVQLLLPRRACILSSGCTVVVATEVPGWAVGPPSAGSWLYISLVEHLEQLKQFKYYQRIRCYPSRIRTIANRKEIKSVLRADASEIDGIQNEKNNKYAFCITAKFGIRTPLPSFPTDGALVDVRNLHQLFSGKPQISAFGIAPQTPE